MDPNLGGASTCIHLRECLTEKKRKLGQRIRKINIQGSREHLESSDCTYLPWDSNTSLCILANRGSVSKLSFYEPFEGWRMCNWDYLIISDEVSAPPSLFCTNDRMCCSMWARISVEGIRIQSLQLKDLWRSVHTVGHYNHWTWRWERAWNNSQKSRFWTVSTLSIRAGKPVLYSSAKSCAEHFRES